MDKLGFRFQQNPAEPLRGRKETTSLREKNLRHLVIAYNDLSPAERTPAARIQYLCNASNHLSKVAFGRLEKERAAAEAAAEAESTSASSQLSSQGSKVPEVHAGSSQGPSSSLLSGPSAASLHRAFEFDFD